MNYTGGKYKLLGSIKPYFPEKINNFIDLFAGGLNVAINVEANNTYCNDINFYLVEIYETIRVSNIDFIIDYINNRINRFGLSKENKEGYLAFRSHYNETRIPLDLFVLTCFSFNHQIRFNNSFNFNSPFGQNRSSYNKSIEKNLIDFRSAIDNFKFSNLNFKDFDLGFMGESDFIYLDPPYLISKAAYSDGKRGFGGWSSDDEMHLYSVLDELNKRGIKFAMSNVLEHKGLSNVSLIDWSNNYSVNFLDHNYKNSSYCGNNTDKKTTEVIITNY